MIGEYLAREVPGTSAAADKKRTKLADKLFQFGDYGLVELDTETMQWRFVPLSEWG